jgi:hypothetical protein
MTTQLSLIFVDPVVAALISRDTCITRYEGGLPEIVANATADQLRQAIELLPDGLRKGRGPVLEFALKKKVTA